MFPIVQFDIPIFVYKLFFFTVYFLTNVIHSKFKLFKTVVCKSDSFLNLQIRLFFPNRQSILKEYIINLGILFVKQIRENNIYRVYYKFDFIRIELRYKENNTIDFTESFSREFHSTQNRK